jgi:lipopolysaccharide biosynthesis protein
MDPEIIAEITAMVPMYQAWQVLQFTQRTQDYPISLGSLLMFRLAFPDVNPTTVAAFTALVRAALREASGYKGR